MDNKDLQDIKKIMKQKIAVSNFQKNSDIMKNENKKIYVIQNIASISACIVFICGIIFSKQITNGVYEYAIAKDIEKVAINSIEGTKFNVEYSNSDEEIIDLENNNQGLSQDSVKIKLENVEMDDNNLKTTFVIELSDEISEKINDQRGVETDFEDVLITDENGNILFCTDEKRTLELLNIDSSKAVEEGLSQNEYNEKELNANEKYFNGSGYSYVLKYSNGNIKLMCNLSLIGKDKYFPRSKSLNFEIGKVKIINDAENEFGGTRLNYKGKWSISVELPEGITNRKMVTYKMIENAENGDNKVELLNVLDSGTEVKLRLKAPEAAYNDISPQLRLINELEFENPTTQIRDYFVDELMTSAEYKKYEEDLMKRYMIQEEYIEDETGKKYGLLKGAYSNGGGKITEDGFYEPILVFDLKSENAKENLKLYIKYCDTEYVFNLVKGEEI